jgi:hypothetical protein
VWLNGKNVFIANIKITSDVAQRVQQKQKRRNENAALTLIKQAFY